MTNVTIYDAEAQQLERIAEDNDTTVAEIIEELVVGYLGEVMENNGWE